MTLPLSNENGLVGFLPPTISGSGGGVTGSSDSSLTIAGSDAIVNVAKAFAWTSNQSWAYASGTNTMTLTDAATNTQVDVVKVRKGSSGTAAAGIGANLVFSVQDDGGTLVDQGRIKSISRTVTAGGVNSTLVFQYMNAGALADGGFIGAGLIGGTSLALGSVSATGLITSTFTATIASTMVTYTSGSASNGGHAFAGTVNTSGARQFFTIQPSANTGGTASTEIVKFEYKTYTNTWAAGAITTQRECVFNAPTYAFASASTITTAATLAITGAPIAGTNATLTKSHSLWIQGGLPRIDSATANGTVATVLGSLGPTGSNTTVQTWLTVDINGTTRYIPCF